MKRRLITALSTLALIACGCISACGSTSTVYVGHQKVMSKKTVWRRKHVKHNGGGSDTTTWVMVHLLVLQNNQTMRVTNTMWNAAVPGTTVATYDATPTGAVLNPSSALSATEEEDNEDLSLSETASQVTQSYDNSVDEATGLTNDDEVTITESEDFSAGDYSITINGVTVRVVV